MSVMNLIPEADYKDACDAIREKDGTTGLIKSGEMGAKIRAIPSGGGGDVQKMLDGVIDGTLEDIKSDSVVSIKDNMFSSYTKLTAADFPAATSIGTNAFKSCNALVTLNLPAATSIGSNAFQYCASLVTVNLSAATSIGSAAFDTCTKLVTLNFPAATSIDTGAFYYCTGLRALRLPGATLCKAIGDPRIWSKCKIYVPASLIEQYKVATNWSKYATQFVAIEGV